MTGIWASHGGTLEPLVPAHVTLIVDSHSSAVVLEEDKRSARQHSAHQILGRGTLDQYTTAPPSSPRPRYALYVHIPK